MSLGFFLDRGEMPVVSQQDDPVLFRFVTDANLLRQYDFLQTTVAVALKQPGYVIGHDIVCSLNRYAVDFLCETPGQYRRQPIFISDGQHNPPNFEEVRCLMEECLRYLVANWDQRDATHLAAYVLWRMNWIHPFVEGNGRAARATSYLVLCLKYGMWLPGTNTVLKQIRADRPNYITALRIADKHLIEGAITDVDALEAYLDALLVAQLQS